MNVEQKPEVCEQVERTRSGRVVSPAVDIIETKDAILLVADLPGVGDQGADVTLEKNILHIRGVIDFKPPVGCSLAHAEYTPASYERSFTISSAIDREQIQASVKHGILRITLPKSKQAQAQKITVRSEA